MKDDLTLEHNHTDALTVTLTLPPLSFAARPAPALAPLLPGDDTALRSFWDEADADWQRQQDAALAAQRQREEAARQAALARRQAAAAPRVRPYSYD